MKKKIVVAITILILAPVATLIAYESGHKSKLAKTKSVKTLVKLNHVTVASVPDIVKSTGTLSANQQAKISAKFGGYIKSINFTEGSHVKAGQILVQLDNEAQKQAYLSDQANTQYAKVTAKRYMALVQQQAVAKQDRDQYLSNYKTALAKEKSDQFALTQMSLRSPISGYAGKKSINIGDYINVGSQVLAVTDTDTLKVEYSVPSNYAPKLKIGQPVEITADYLPGKTIAATVSYVAPTIDQDTQTIEVHAKLNNQQHELKPGQSVNISEILDTSPNTIEVPSNAVMPSIDGDHVYQVINNKVVATPVITGINSNNMTVIKKGLEKGDTFISQGQFQVKIGENVKVVM